MRLHVKPSPLPPLKKKNKPSSRNLTYTPFSSAPNAPSTLPPHLSVQLQPALISTVSLQREPLKGWMAAAAAATEPPTRDLSKRPGQRKSERKGKCRQDSSPVEEGGWGVGGGRGGRRWPCRVSLCCLSALLTGPTSLPPTNRPRPRPKRRTAT